MGNCWACLKAKDSSDTQNRLPDSNAAGAAGSVPIYSGGAGLLGAGDVIPERSGKHIGFKDNVRYFETVSFFVCLIETDGLLSQSPQHFTNLIVESHLISSLKKPNPILGTHTTDAMNESGEFIIFYCFNNVFLLYIFFIFSQTIPSGVRQHTERPLRRV